MNIEALAWPLERLGEGLEVLARRARLGANSGFNEGAPALPASVQHGPAVERARWVSWACARLAVEAEAVDTAVPEIEALLRDGGPALLTLRLASGPHFVLLLGGRGLGQRTVRVMGADLRVRRCPIDSLRSAICAPFELPLIPEIDRLLERAAVEPKRRARVRTLMLAERLAGERIDGCWILRQPPHASFWRQMAMARLPRRVFGMLGVFAAIYTLEITGWRVIGAAALDGRLDLGQLIAWALLVLTLVPLRACSAWLDASFALGTGRLLKQRLLAGALRLPLDAVRQLGAGQLLGRVIESQALEALALNGGLAVLVALLEMSFAAWILSAGAAPALHLALLAGWLALNAALAFRYCRTLRRWTLARLEMTQHLVEQMVGHRTRLAQELPTRRDAAEDQQTDTYLRISKQMDTALVPIVAGVPGGWILVALAGLAPAFAAGQATPAALAISLGGILFAHRALGGISGGLGALARAGIAWQQVATIFRAGSGAPDDGPFVEAIGAAEPHAGSTLVDASDLGFRYRAQGAAVLRDANLTIAKGERVLLEGASGGGKSTLAALLVGLRRPDSGLLLLGGLDRHTLGDTWHRLATEAPQFHDNHVLTASLGFNLLMGRQWPASDAELTEARALCDELGLGELIERMPAGLQQRVGETGWQLSHGERSRLFLARALLQRAPLTVLDESFAALDPQTLKRCLDTALRRTQALVVIAHL